MPIAQSFKSFFIVELTCLFIIGFFGIPIWAAEEGEPVLALGAVPALLGAFWCFWFSQFIGRVEALEAAAKETAEEEENG